MKRVLAQEAKNFLGQKILLQGWVRARRDIGKLIFIDLKDRSGLIQVVFGFSKENPELLKTAQKLKAEYVVKIIGIVNSRPSQMINPNLPTGDLEVIASELTILNPAKTLPFEIDQDTRRIGEDLRLKYRYLDLKSDRLQKNLRLRAEFIHYAREFLRKNDFLEIETPLLTKATPEGSRDFVVPSRLYPGKFYALPQSPQQYKQLLMVAGIERYFQIAHVLRDEDLRADRAFEHTQIDLEMSFASQEEILNLVEEMVIYVVEKLGFQVKEKPFPRFTYKEALEKFGADKFDLRTEEEKKKNILAYAWVTDFPFFEKDKNGHWTFTHNPFSMPLPQYLEDHLAQRNIENILAAQYDLVCNGFEAGGGSLRAHRPEILKATYQIMGYSEKEIENSVGHMLEAFEYGAPPHGGIALGVERNLMGLTQENFLREVQAFPMSSSGRTAVMDAPSELSPEQLQELNLKIIQNND